MGGTELHERAGDSRSRREAAPGTHGVGPDAAQDLLDFPHPVRFDRDYWLTRCVGFRVVSPLGDCGRVEAARYASRHDRPDFLVVRSGFFRPRRTLVALKDVAEIDPRRRFVRLSSGG